MGAPESILMRRGCSECENIIVSDVNSRLIFPAFCVECIEEDPIRQLVVTLLEDEIGDND